MGNTTFKLVVQDKLLISAIITIDKNCTIRPVAIIVSDWEDSNTYEEGLDIVKTSLD